MNETNELETQLRSWKPRRPSPALERKIFGRRVAAPERGAAAKPRIVFPAFASLLAPAAACVLVTGTLLNHSGPGLTSPAASGEALAGLSMSNQSYAAYLPGSFQLDVNRLDTFRWTNTGRFHSPMDSLSPK